MPSLPNLLRSGREAMGLTEQDVAEITKIRTDHIRALEEGNYNAFAAPVYVRGFVRTYARLIRLDPRETVAQLDAELHQLSITDNPHPLTGRRGFLDVLMLQLSKVNWRVAAPTLTLAVLVLVSVLAYRTWVEHRARDPLTQLGPGLYQPPPPHDSLPLPDLLPTPATTVPSRPNQTGSFREQD
jgi:cytoskeletal protein RodZ